MWLWKDKKCIIYVVEVVLEGTLIKSRRRKVFAGLNNFLLKPESQTKRQGHTLIRVDFYFWTNGSSDDDWPLQSPGIVQDRLQVCEAEGSVEAVPIPAHLSHGGKLAA